MKHKYITFWLSTALLLTSMAIQAQTNYFRMIGGIPHLPVVANTAAVGSPVTGAMVFSQADAQTLVYNGAAWYGLCDLPDPETTGSATYFRVVGGLPCMAVLSSVSGTGTQSGMVYYAASGAEGLKIFNGSAYVSLADGFTGGTTNSKASVLTGGDKLLSIPVLSTAPTGIEAGAVYLDNTTGQFLVYDGTAWLPLVCDCPPQATALLAPNGGETIFDDAGFTATYAYHDKDNDTEDASVIDWYLATDSTGNNDGSAVFTGSTYNYTYQTADNGKYLRFSVTPEASSGLTPGDVVYSDYTLIYNCSPLLTTTDNISGDYANMNSNDFSFGGSYIYSDKEGDEEGSALQYRWFVSSAVDGGGTTTTAGTAETYTFADAHNGQYLNLAIAPTAATGNVLGDETIIYGQLLQNDAPVASALQLPGDDGTGLIGTSQILAPDYTYSDTENNTEGASIIEWYLATDTTVANNDDALQATAATYNYTYNVVDEGKFIRYAVTPKAATGYSTGTKVYSPYSEIHNCVPQATALQDPNGGETIFGDAGFTASYAFYDKDNDAEDASVIEWYLAADSSGNNDGSAVFTGSTYNYSYQTTDNGKYLCYTVTPVAATGATPGDVVKSGYTLIYNCPPLVSNLTLSGAVSVGSTLSVGYIYSDKEGDEEASSTYQWYRATASDGSGATSISGATAQSYTLESDDRWNYIGVSVTPVSSTGNNPGDEVAAYTTTTVPGPQVCPSATLTVTHTAGSVAPVTQEITYQLVETDLGTPLLARQCWLAQNLGASVQASSATDTNGAAAGWFWQFNRKQGYKMDGFSRIPMTTWITSIDENSDWTLANDPCRLLMGGAWRLPTSTEWMNADSNGSWSNYNHTFGSVLKLHAAGHVDETFGNLREEGHFGSYWSSTQYSNNEGYYLFLDSGNAYTNHYVKARGYTVRCLMEN